MTYTQYSRCFDEKYPFDRKTNFNVGMVIEDLVNEIIMEDLKKIVKPKNKIDFIVKKKKKQLTTTMPTTKKLVFVVTQSTTKLYRYSCVDYKLDKNGQWYIKCGKVWDTCYEPPEHGKTSNYHRTTQLQLEKNLAALDRIRKEREEEMVCCVGCGEVVCKFSEEPPHKDDRDEAVCSECYGEPPAYQE
tara:strand:+ start:642 stop:1205 length:564 start_codon:yes stop_codon:yes gene_type:complete